MHGFTCGVDDLIILPHYDMQRKEELEGEDVGEEVHSEFVKCRPGQLGPTELQMEIEKAICRDRDRESAIASLDMKMKNKLSIKESQITNQLLTNGLLKPFPWNCMSLMTISGAKGNTVNFQQISCCLGQQELEGKRVPRMVSGKSLPCFPSWDFTSRSGGYITDNFLSGLRPQEYYFHCMAGREGLIDPVKTSRIGYLQRCLVKNLESLKVCYDYTARDADGSIVQFNYGDDGVDAHRSSFLTNFKALSYNQDIICQNQQVEFNAYIQQLPIGLLGMAQEFIRSNDIKDEAEFLEVVENKYVSSLAQSGEPVGVIAAQSLGEPFTQMTFNTFNQNVTLGITRLQEILMTASNTIKNPVLTCPFQQWRPKDYAKSLVAKVKKVSIADVIDTMDVRVLLSVHNENSSWIYIIKIKIKENEYVSLEDSQETLKYHYLRKLEKDIAAHLLLHSKINNGVSEASNEDIDDDIGEDLGSDARKQANDVMHEISEMQTDAVKLKPKPRKSRRGTDKDGKAQGKDKDSKKTHLETSLPAKESDRNIFVDVKGLQFEVHFRFTKKPHFLLSKIALESAKKVFIKSSGKNDNYQIVGYHLNENTVVWDEAKRMSDSSIQTDDEESGFSYWALKATGTDFHSFWRMEDDLDVTRLYSNNIRSMLRTYGVEAARASIIRELKQVCARYGVDIDYRHLSLVADYMTQSGGYTPMSRHGSISGSLSPLLKMSFETPSKFIAQAASHGLTDTLETPSSRVCLGLPIKAGTGSFDLFQYM